MSILPNKVDDELLVNIPTLFSVYVKRSIGISFLIIIYNHSIKNDTIIY